MATQILLSIDGFQGIIPVSTFEMTGSGGGASLSGQFEFHGPGGGAAHAGGILTVTMEGGSALTQLSQAFASKRTFPSATLSIEEGQGAPTILTFTTLVVVGISGIADEDGSEYQVIFAYGSVS